MLNIFDNPRKHHRALRRALRDRGATIYHCKDCGYVWIASASKSPKRCANRQCRAPAQGNKRPASSAQERLLEALTD